MPRDLALLRPLEACTDKMNPALSWAAWRSLAKTSLGVVITVAPIEENSNREVAGPLDLILRAEARERNTDTQASMNSGFSAKLAQGGPEAPLKDACLGI